MSPAVVAQAKTVFPNCRFNQGYGQTETSPSISRLPSQYFNPDGLYADKLASGGQVVMNMEAKIVDPFDNELPPGDIGEIVVRGPHVMAGYWNKPKETAQALRGGWMHTGDAARMDEDGYVYIQDRIKDMIVTGGENVYPREVENALFAHPAVADVAVIGIPDPKFGEAILAFVVLREGHSVAADELIAFARARIAGYKVPRKIEVLDALPRNASGKVLKKDLREPYWQGHQRRVGG
jgi:acyl-CoA synthetase (AMP-forming)/AMP-acid ligase II